MTNKRRFIDAPRDERCTAVVTLSDGGQADCGRYRKVGTLCRQHAKIAASHAVEQRIVDAIERTDEDIARFRADMSRIAATLGRKGGAAGTGAAKRRDVDYAALGRKGGMAGKGAIKKRDKA